jgi:two-component system NtrC family sensor kinase
MIMAKLTTDESLNGLASTGKIQSDKIARKSSWNEWHKLAHMVQKIATNLEEVSLLDTVIQYALQITNAERGFLILINEYGVLDYRVINGLERQELDKIKATLGKTIIDRVLKKKFPVIVTNTSVGDQTKTHALAEIGIVSAMCVPIITKNRLFGAVYVDSCSKGNLFANQDLVDLDAFINLASIAVENAQLFRSLSQTTQGYVTLKEYHEQILRSLPMGEVVINDNGTIEYMNEFASKLWDLKSGEGIGKHLKELFIDVNGSAKFILELWEKYRQGKKDISCDISIGENDYQVTFFDVLWWGHNKVRAGLLIMDISARKAADEKLVDQDKQATVIQLAGGIAHEVNNLLATITGRTELLQLRIGQLAKELSKNVGGDFKVIFNQAKKLQKIVEDLRRLSKPSSPEIVPTDVSACIAMAVDVLSSSAGRIKYFRTDDPTANYYLGMDLEPDLPKIMGDAQSLEQMFINLILNAADAVKEKKGGRIVLRTRVQEGYLIATVEDTGCGIPDNIKNRVFEPYFTTKGPKHGTGLGMAIIRRIADIHGASVSLDSEEGVGTTVTISFPVERNILKIGDAQGDSEQIEYIV